MNNYLITLLTVFSFYTSQSQIILGETTVCTESCLDYSIEGGLGGPYLWSTDIGRMDSNKGQVVTCLLYTSPSPRDRG